MPLGHVWDMFGTASGQFIVFVQLWNTLKTLLGHVCDVFGMSQNKFRQE